MSLWWRQPDHFDWFTSYLHLRRMATTVPHEEPVDRFRAHHQRQHRHGDAGAERSPDSHLGVHRLRHISGYIALFHTSFMMTANLVVTLGVSAVPAMALAVTDGVVRAVCACGVMLVVNIAVAYGIQIIVHTLGVDVLRADRDHLTGLYHRRAFYQRTTSLVAGYPGQAHLVMAMLGADGCAPSLPRR
jgi:hypothetical protein